MLTKSLMINPLVEYYRLLTTTGPCAMYHPDSRRSLKYLTKQKIKKMLGRPCNPQFYYYLAVEGFVLRKM